MTELINTASHGATIGTEVFRPRGAGNGAAIVLAHGSDGMTPPWADLIREDASAFAGRGFTVFIPRYFEKTGTAAGPGVFAQIATSLSLWVEAVGDVVATVKGFQGIRPERVGLLGFSLGGHICLRLRESTSAVTAFFAPELRQLGGIGKVAPGATPQIEIHHGLADLLVPFTDAQAIAATLKGEGAVVKLFSYEGAGHGFAGADPSNAAARRASQHRTLFFFETQLVEHSVTTHV